MKTKHEFSEIEKVMLINAHPVKNLFNFIGLAFGLYFLWQKDAVMALITGLGPALLGTIIATAFFKIDIEKLARTTWGKLFLCYTTKIGFGLYIASHILVPLGFWLNNLLVSVVGLFCLIIGVLIYKKVLNH